MFPASPSPGTPDRVRFEARPPAPGGRLWAVVRVTPYGKADVLAYGSRRRCEALARSLQAREDGR